MPLPEKIALFYRVIPQIACVERIDGLGAVLHIDHGRKRIFKPVILMLRFRPKDNLPVAPIRVDETVHVQSPASFFRALLVWRG